MLCLALAVILILAIPTSAPAQAWTPAKGELVVNLSYQHLNGGNHFFSDSVVLGTDHGERSVDLGTVKAHVLQMSAEIGITERLTLEGGVPFIATKYVGSDPHPGHGGDPVTSIDQGLWNSNFQDGRIGARYKLVNRRSWVLTPSAYYGFPTSDYPVLGHSSLGRHLKELRLGLNAGRVLNWSDRPNGYVQASYSYAFMEDIEHVSLDRSDTVFEVGFFLPKSLTVQAFAHHQKVHGGLDWAGDLHLEHEHIFEFLDNHDATAATHFWRAGGGLSFPLTNRVELFGNVSKTLWGVNTHDAVTVTVGLSWSFQVFGRLKAFGN